MSYAIKVVFSSMIAAIVLPAVGLAQGKPAEAGLWRNINTDKTL
jgi:hypothetical protein